MPRHKQKLPFDLDIFHYRTINESCNEQVVDKVDLVDFGNIKRIKELECIETGLLPSYDKLIDSKRSKKSNKRIKIKTLIRTDSLSVYLQRYLCDQNGNVQETSVFRDCLKRAMLRYKNTSYLKKGNNSRVHVKYYVYKKYNKFNLKELLDDRSCLKPLERHFSRYVFSESYKDKHILIIKEPKQNQMITLSYAAQLSLLRMFVRPDKLREYIGILNELLMQMVSKIPYENLKNNIETCIAKHVHTSNFFLYYWRALLSILNTLTGDDRNLGVYKEVHNVHHGRNYVYLMKNSLFLCASLWKIKSSSENVSLLTQIVRELEYMASQCEFYD